ncbi:MAG TPA: glycosyl hydrolase 115 family protein [Bryobacteraceae bacterium]|nr:glycosyl hydrolase 115 family protein [Bryobacteraceae bacterium]
MRGQIAEISQNGLPASLGKWKHGVYYHLACLGGNLSKQTTHTETAQPVADEFQKIVKAGATEYMLVNVSELRDCVMGARTIADICWNAPAIMEGRMPQLATPPRDLANTSPPKQRTFMRSTSPC